MCGYKTADVALYRRLKCRVTALFSLRLILSCMTGDVCAINFTLIYPMEVG